MRRRRRSVAFGLLALVAAAGGAAIADSYRASAVHGFGGLRPVVIVEQSLRAGQRIGPGELASHLVPRRVPGRFVPPGALAFPREALGLVARGPLPVGSYLLAAQLGTGHNGKARRPHLGGGRRPVEIEVSGADALLAAGPSPVGASVDVVVTSEPASAGPGRTYLAAARVPLLALRPAPEGEATAAATLGLTKREALRLIAAESFARKLTLLPEG